jgi:hypothetical protein
MGESMWETTRVDGKVPAVVILIVKFFHLDGHETRLLLVGRLDPLRSFFAFDSFRGFGPLLPFKAPLPFGLGFCLLFHFPLPFGECIPIFSDDCIPCK